MARAKKTGEPEYRLYISPVYDDREHVYKTGVLLETTRLFSSFRYDLSVREDVTNTTIRYKVLGLKTPPLSLPTTGHARFFRLYEKMKGTYQIIVEGLDGNENAFSVRVADTRIDLLTSPKEKFVELITNAPLSKD